MSLVGTSRPFWALLSMSVMGITDIGLPPRMAVIGSKSPFDRLLRSMETSVYGKIPTAINAFSHKRSGSRSPADAKVIIRLTMASRILFGPRSRSSAIARSYAVSKIAVVGASKFVSVSKSANGATCCWAMLHLPLPQGRSAVIPDTQRLMIDPNTAPLQCQKRVFSSARWI